MSDPSSTRLWLASVLIVNDDTTLRSHGFFRQAFGIGSGQQFAHSWTFSPSLWLLATQTSDSRNVAAGAHATITWRHRVEEAWGVACGATVELGQTIQGSDIEMRVNIEHEIPWRAPHTKSFAQWASVRRMDATADNGRLQVGIRTQLRDGLQLIAAFNRAKGSNGNGPMSGGLLVMFYQLRTRSGHTSR